MTPLLDNKVFHTYRYRVSVFTGLRRNAGTTSNVCFILAGNQGDSGMRLLDDGKKKVLVSLICVIRKTFVCCL